MRWVWVAAAVLLGATALGIYSAIQNPTWALGFVLAAAGALWKAIAPALLNPMSEAQKAERDQAVRQGRDDERIRRQAGSLRPDR